MSRAATRLGLLVTALLASLPAAAATKSVAAGSAGNEVRLTLSNPQDDVAIDGLAVEVVGRPEWVRSLVVEADSSGPLSPGGARAYTVRFSVAADVAAGTTGEVVLRTGSDREALASLPDIPILLSVRAPEGAGGTVAGAGAQGSAEGTGNPSPRDRPTEGTDTTGRPAGTILADLEALRRLDERSRLLAGLAEQATERARARYDELATELTGLERELAALTAAGGGGPGTSLAELEEHRHRARQEAERAAELADAICDEVERLRQRDDAAVRRRILEDAAEADEAVAFAARAAVAAESLLAELENGSTAPGATAHSSRVAGLERRARAAAGKLAASRLLAEELDERARQLDEIADQAEEIGLRLAGPLATGGTPDLEAGADPLGEVSSLVAAIEGRGPTAAAAALEAHHRREDLANRADLLLDDLEALPAAPAAGPAGLDDARRLALGARSQSRLSRSHAERAAACLGRLPESGSESGWTKGAREPAAAPIGVDRDSGWVTGSRTEERDPCSGPRPEYEAALARVEAAARRRDFEALTTALASLPGGCPGDAEWLAGLRDKVVEVARAEADRKASRMREDLGRARSRRERRAAAWGRLADTLTQTLSELQRPSPSGRPAGGAPSGGASSIGTPSAGGGCTLGVQLFGSGERVYFLVEWTSAPAYVVTSYSKEISSADRAQGISTPLDGAKAVFLDRPGRPYRVVGEYASQEAAMAAGRQLCPQ